jgi:hypothetical protein
MDYEMASVSERRPQRRPKPTTRALESAQQEEEWDGSDPDPVLWQAVEESKRSARRSEVSAQSEASGSAGASTGRATRSGGKRRRVESESAASECFQRPRGCVCTNVSLGSSKRIKATVEPEPVPTVSPMVQLRQGDYILSTPYLFGDSLCVSLLLCNRKAI